MKGIKHLKVVLLANFCLLAVSSIVISCRKTETKEVEQQPKTETFVKRVVSTQNSIDEFIKMKILKRFGKVKLRKKMTGTIKSNSTSSNFIDAMNENVALDNPTITSYVGSDIQAILFEQPNSIPGNTFSFVTFTQNGLVGDIAMIVQSEQLTSTLFRASIFDLDYNLIGQFFAENGDTYNFQGFEPPPPSTAIYGWWGRWGSCIANGWNGMFNGNPVNAATGLACAYFAGPCVVGAALGCAASATFH